MLEQTEENIRQNFFYFIYGGAGPLHRLRLRPKRTGSAPLTVRIGECMQLEYRAIPPHFLT